MAVKVAVTKPEFQKAQSVFLDARADGCECIAVPTEERELAAALRRQQTNYVIVGVEPYRGPLYQALLPGGVIARFGVGHDGLDKAQATENGLLCTNTPGVLDDSVAEHTMNLLLALARQTPALAQATRAGEWSPRLGVELSGKKLAVLGCGGIGRRVARIAAHGFGMQVTGLKRSVSDTRELMEQFGFARIVTEFDEAVKEAKFISLHLPSTPATRHFLDRSRLEALPINCYLINTARGALVDEVTLFEGLFSGRIAGAALDVFEQEPYHPQAPDRDLRQLPNVIMTPHVGSSTREACDRMAERALRNIRLAISGRYQEMDLLNQDVLARLRRPAGESG